MAKAKPGDPTYDLMNTTWCKFVNYKGQYKYVKNLDADGLRLLLSTIRGLEEMATKKLVVREKQSSNSEYQRERRGEASE